MNCQNLKYNRGKTCLDNGGSGCCSDYEECLWNGREEGCITKNIYAPDKYFEGLTQKEKSKRLKRIKKGSKTKSYDANAYKPFETDFRDGIRIKTRPSRYTQQWKKYFPNANSLEEKSIVSGVPLYILEKVYNKGMAAWRTGHRPGATQQQWGYARVHSFLVKGKTFWTTDKKLAIEAIESSPEAEEWFYSIDGLCDYDNSENTWCDKICPDYKLCS